MSRMYVMRHAEAEIGPQMDPTRGLTDLGKRQAKMMGKWLARQTEKPDLVIASNMRRSHQTAKRVAKELDCPLVRSFVIDPDGDAKTALTGMQDIAKANGSSSSVIAVSHGPLVEMIAAEITEGAVPRFHFPHAAVMHFTLLRKGQFHWLVTPNTVARDEDEMENVTRDAHAVVEAALKVAAECFG